MPYDNKTLITQKFESDLNQVKNIKLEAKGLQWQKTLLAGRHEFSLCYLCWAQNVVSKALLMWVCDNTTKYVISDVQLGVCKSHARQALKKLKMRGQ